MIEFQNVTKQYEGHTALRNVSFSIDSGIIFGLLGPNGSGKTTLLRILTRMLLPDEGKILYNGREVSDTLLPYVGYLPEERGLYPKMEVAEHIHFLSSLKGIKHKLSEERLRYWAEELEISPLLKRKVENLSKGQQQKVQLIACLIHEPELLILDEPFSGFDPINAELLKKVLFELRDKGKTIIISTHRMDNAEELCNQVAMLYNGSLVLNGALSDILKQKSSFYEVSVTQFFIESPSFRITGKAGQTQTIQISDGYAANAVLAEIMKQTKIISFTPCRKSLRDVFLEKAK